MLTVLTRVRLSLVIPAYNEEGRLPAFLEDIERYHAQGGHSLHEVMVIDDGSTDRTAEIAERYSGRLPLRLIRFLENRGKGAAVRAGVFAATGDMIVFMDADGATSPAELGKMTGALAKAPIAVGNRWILGSRVADREPFRAFSGWIYRTYVGLFGLRGIDTMCGFKGFQKETAHALFTRLGNERWLFDTEVMLRARRRGVPITHVPISWTSKHGSKLRPSVLVRSFFEIPLLALRVLRERQSPPL